MEKVKFNPETCIVCTQCVPVCPDDVFQGVIAYVEGYLNSITLKVYLDSCTGCRYCENICPTDAIYFDAPPPPLHDTYYQGTNIKFSENLPGDIKDELIATLNSMAPCVRAKLKNSSNLDLTFKHDNSVGYLAKYISGTHEILIGHSSIISHELLSHELFHGYQDIIYPGMANGVIGRTNIEFEQYVFQNIAFSMENYSSLIGNQISDAGLALAFRTWIQELTNSGSTFPNLSEFPDFDTQYNYFLDAYDNYGPSSYSGDQTNSDPDALKTFFDGEGC